MAEDPGYKRKGYDVMFDIPEGANKNSTWRFLYWDKRIEDAYP